MDDLISRLSEIRSNYNCLNESEEPYYRALSEAIQLVSAQPEKRTEKHTETHSCDCISRQAAIDAMCAACWDWCDEGVCKRASALQQLPSAQLLEVFARSRNGCLSLPILLPLGKR